MKNPMLDMTIRNAEKSDSALIFNFIKELAIYEKAEAEVVTSEQGIAESLFSAQAIAHAIICERGGQAIAYAVYFYNYSTWLGKKGLYLEDLYVTPSQRRQGVAKAMLKYLANIALEQGCARFEWSVLDWNTPAIEFYQSIAAKPLDQWTIYRLTGQDLVKLADS